MKAATIGAIGLLLVIAGCETNPPKMVNPAAAPNLFDFVTVLADPPYSLVLLRSNASPALKSNAPPATAAQHRSAVKAAKALCNNTHSTLKELPPETNKSPNAAVVVFKCVGGDLGLK